MPSRPPLGASVCGILLSCLLSATARGQYRLDHWTTDNALPQNSVRDILRTRDGYLWITTFDGLVRFDGVRFTVFNRSNTPGLAGSRFVSLFEDRDGDLWAGLETGEVVRKHRGRFTTYASASRSPGGPAFLTDDGHGHVALRYERVVRLETNGVGEAEEEVHRFSGGRFQEAADLSSSFEWPALRSPAEQHAASRVWGGERWFFTTERVFRVGGSGTRVYDVGSGLPGTRPVPVSDERGPKLLLTRDAADRLWLTEIPSMRHELLAQRAPENFDPIWGYADDEGNLWIAAIGNGLFRARRNTVTPYGRRTGLGFSDVYPMLEGRDGSLWIGTAGNGLYRLKDGVFTLSVAPRGESEEPFFFGGSLVTCLYEDRAGRLWVNGFWRLSNGRLERDSDPETERLIRTTSTVSMLEDRDGARWLGTQQGVLRLKDGAYAHFTTRDGLAGDDTKVIIGDGSNGLWLGGTGGLTHYANGVFKAWTEKDGVPEGTVRALRLDDQGTLWIGTYDGGLGRFRDGRFTRYSTRDGLFDNGAFQILEDDSGWVWMSSNRGIYRVRKRELEDFAAGRIRTVTSTSYDAGDGMLSAECNGGRWPAGVKTKDGKLWFPTMGGLAMIDPRSVPTSTQPPPVVIEAMRIDRRPVDLDDRQAAVQVLPGQRDFEIDYTAPSFVKSEHLRFRYRLEGADQGWIDAGTRRTAYYSRVPQGSYTFRVIAANADGVWNETGATVPVTVVPHVTQTWWFRTLAVTGCASLVAAAWSVRVRRLQKTQEAQRQFARELIRSQEHERKRIAGELHDSLGQNLLIVKHRAQLGQAAGQGPELQQQLDAIVSLASQSLDEVRGIAQNLRPYPLDRLGLTKSLEVMIENVAQTTGTKVRGELVPLDDLFGKEDAITFYRVVQEGLSNVVKHANASEAVVSVDRSTDSVTLTIRDDGRGLSPDDPSRLHGFGLAGMAERARMLGAELAIESAEGRGTRLTIRLGLPIVPGGAAA